MSGKSFSELDWWALGIETLSGVASGLLLSFGAVGKLSKHAVNTGKVIISGLTSVAHSVTHQEELGIATVKATGSMLVTRVRGNISESRYQPRHAKPRPTSETITGRLGRAAVRSAPNVPDIASGVISTGKQIINSFNSSSSSYYYTSGMSSFLTYSQAINYGLI